ncbi:MAG: hypothetical protein U9R73_06910 [Pseudomonadota bacterium]|nr:hypothetical protein [Pseudomonadota bacterium]
MLRTLDAEPGIEGFLAAVERDSETEQAGDNSRCHEERQHHVAGFPDQQDAASRKTGSHDDGGYERSVEAAHQIHIDSVEHRLCPREERPFHTLPVPRNSSLALSGAVDGTFPYAD